MAAADFSAGDFLSGVACRLGCEIIRPTVDDYSPAEDVPDTKAPGQEGGKSKAVITEQGRHIPGMLGMGAALRVIMGAGVCKGVAGVSCAAAAAVYVKGKNRVLTCPFRRGQAGDLSHYDHTLHGLEKPHCAADVWIVAAALDIGNG